MSDTYKVNESLPTTDKIELLNTFIMSLEGKIKQSEFNLNEINEIYSGIGYEKKYLRDIPLGHTLDDYDEWSHLKAEAGYSIWKIAPDNYTYNVLNQLYFDNKVLTNEGEASTESAMTFSGANGLILLYNGSSFTDDTTEAGTETGTAFSLMDATNEFLYLGSETKFKGAKFEFNARGSNYTNILEIYHSGAGWVALSANIDSYDDDTSNFESDGNITWDLDSATGAGWIETTINSHEKYWARIKTTTTPVTTATVNYLIPSSSVIGLLSLSSSEVENEEWAWCTYLTNIYVTIRNNGAAAYEGDYYITSSSSTTNLQNFFVYNHEYKADYEDSSYIDANQAISKVKVSANDTLQNYLNNKIRTGAGIVKSIYNALGNEELQLDVLDQHNRLHYINSGSDHYASAAADKGKYIRADASTGEIEFDDVTFLTLTDTPSSYLGEATKTVSVNAAGTALEFVTNVTTDEKVKVTSNDTTADFLNSKLISGSGIQITEMFDGTNEKLYVHNTRNLFSKIDVSGQSIIEADATFDTLTIATGAGMVIVSDAATDTVTFSANVVDAFKQIDVAGQSSIVADTAIDILTLATGAGITITTNAATDTITFTTYETDVGTITFLLDGGGSAITVGSKGDLEIPFACTTQSWTLLADRAGAIIVDIWKDDYNNFPPTGVDSMPGSGSGKEPVIVASDIKAQNLNITDWGATAIAAGQTLRFHVNSCTSIQRCTLSLKIRKT